MTFSARHWQTAPVRTGIGLRAPHVSELVSGASDTLPVVDWLEIHAENYMAGGNALAAIEMLRNDYPISLHGVGLSLGSADGIDPMHLSRLRALSDRLQPFLISEHLSWSTINGHYLNDLLPLPYTYDTLDIVRRNMDQAQEALGRAILIENPSLYLSYRLSDIPEAEFLSALARRTGCGILCDVNNIYVSAHNTGVDAKKYLNALPRDAVRQIHLAGHFTSDADGWKILIDDHGSEVSAEVWALYGHAIKRFGPIPTLVEWDNNLPPLAQLVAQARLARTMASLALEALL
jgi:uncharacterized protein